MAKTMLRKPNISKLKPRRPATVDLKSAKFWTSLLLLAGLILLGTSGYFWYKNVFSDADRVFYGMLSRSLETDSVTRQVTQDEASRSVNQTYYISFSPETVIESSSTIDQVGQDRSKSSVTTRTIGERDTDYVQYSEINVPQSLGSKNDFSKVLNQWAKRQNKQESGEQAQFLNEAIFTFIPFGNFSQENRTELINLIKQAQVYKISRSETSYQNGRPMMDLTVSIKPKALIEVLREYAAISGLGQQDLLDPSQYEKASDVSVQIKIDMLSRHLTNIDFPGETRKETYGSYGLNRNVSVPTGTISVEELQSRLQN